MANLNIEALVLKRGSHDSLEEGACLLEAVSYIAGEEWSDHPQCVSRVLAAFGRAWNDGMRSDEERDSLKQYIPRLIGTAGDVEADERRAWLATDWLVRVCAPAWLRLAGLTNHADMLASLQPIASAAYAGSVQGKIAAARAAAWAAARAAVWDAVWDAAVAAAGAAVGAAAVDAAGAAAGSAAWAAVRAAAGSAAWAAAGDAAGAVSWAAARAAAMAVLEPTTIALQQSAHSLYSLMIDAAPVPETWPAIEVSS